MHYQVVARPCITSAERWDYYPYLAPGRDKEAAERLARYAAQSGYEAAILQSVTMEMLVNIARAVVDQQNADLLPALRYAPGARVGEARLRQDHAVELAWQAPATIDPYVQGPNKVELDARRSSLESGRGGDVTAQGTWQRQPVSLPVRMDVLGSWLRLRARMAQGQVGGAADGADDEADGEDVS